MVVAVDIQQDNIKNNGHRHSKIGSNKNSHYTIQQLINTVGSLPNDRSLLTFKVDPTTYARLSAEIERNVRRHDYDPDQSLLVAFRSSDGETINADDCLEIDLSDFAAGKLTCGDETIKIHLPFAKLTAFLHAAERWQKAEDVGDESAESSPSERRFSSTSAEELDPLDESKFEELEKKEEDRAEAEDADFILPRVKRRR
ncbi:hypothetical protein SEPCBS119000_006517 [Sporothrix epigloea]|uniref:Uncharacterized protein n=1 Tax=Sporothrix epigloea TaxID=1892477 RepID=A0ABP0E3G5_9PEZI